MLHSPVVCRSCIGDEAEVGLSLIEPVEAKWASWGVRVHGVVASRAAATEDPRNHAMHAHAARGPGDDERASGMEGAPCHDVSSVGGEAPAPHPTPFLAKGEEPLRPWARREPTQAHEEGDDALGLCGGAKLHLGHPPSSEKEDGELVVGAEGEVAWDLGCPCIFPHHAPGGPGRPARSIERTEVTQRETAKDVFHPDLEGEDLHRA
jgi:hypothetical protein